jgi:hypothetical protein
MGVDAVSTHLACFLLPILPRPNVKKGNSMAEVLLNRQSRVLLARVLEGKACPHSLDKRTYRAIQRGDRVAVSIRQLSALVAYHGEIVIQAIPGLAR